MPNAVPPAYTRRWAGNSARTRWMPLTVKRVATGTAPRAAASPAERADAAHVFGVNLGDAGFPRFRHCVIPPNQPQRYPSHSRSQEEPFHHTETAP